MRDADIDAAINTIEKRANEEAEKAIRDILTQKHPDKPFQLTVSSAVAYTLIWQPLPK